MLLRATWKAAPRTAAWRGVRTFSFGSRPTRLSLSRVSYIGIVSGGIFTTSLVLGNVSSSIHADAEKSETVGHSERPPTPLSALVRSYLVYSICSVPTIVDWSPAILSALTSVPGIKQLTEAIVRVTFFNQFVGGDTAEDAVPLLENLRAENKGCLFGYSVEVDEAQAAGKGASQSKQSVHKQIVEETIHCIDVAADFEAKHAHGRLTGRRTWVAVKLSALLPNADSLIRLSKYLVATRPTPFPLVAFPGRPLPTDLDVLTAHTPPSPLTEEDVISLRELRSDLGAICARAQARGIKVIIDAEHSWYQPAIDALTLSLIREFNKLPVPARSSWFRSSPPPAPVGVQPLVYATYQAYLRRTPEFLAQSFEAARKEGYSLGVKLVRGAYHPQEIAAHASPTSLSISPDPLPPVWPVKSDTDNCYNTCAAVLVKEIAKDVARGEVVPRVGVLFGSHNAQSCDRILSQLAKSGLATVGADGILDLPDEVTERITLAQLYGMSDQLTNSLVDRTRCSSPFVLKYIPYGNLSEVMPYLSRRAIENKSVLGNGAAADERRRAWAEISKRIFG
ncbi:FAD-linked oxidoreductase [Sparassis crispa]|uniref:Proline dehydrogenase n=1 Tax=Sparassis crispa TaxID=139825 RepID=A0A401G8Z0_9APHY|nr:FAD-linked oxidoreductase [Sparassis crispa]GBE78609.1 FAD-linked oxidoreductase [Sparassis crispa]